MTPARPLFRILVVEGSATPVLGRRPLPVPAILARTCRISPQPDAKHTNQRASSESEQQMNLSFFSSLRQRLTRWLRQDRRKRSFQLSVESLEDRCNPTTLSLTSAGASG